MRRRILRCICLVRSFSDTAPMWVQALYVAYAGYRSYGCVDLHWLRLHFPGLPLTLAIKNRCAQSSLSQNKTTVIINHVDVDECGETLTPTPWLRTVYISRLRSILSTPLVMFPTLPRRSAYDFVLETRPSLFLFSI